MKRLLIFSGLLLTLFPLVSNAVTLSWVGCGITKKAFMQELAVAYEKKTDIQIHLEGGGAVKGILAPAGHLADMGGSCRYRIEGEAKGANIRFNPVAWDALVVVVNKNNPVDTISMQQLRDLYSGKATNWRALGGADQPIDLLVRKGKISGVGLTIRRLVFGDEEAEFPQNHVYSSTGPIEEAIENNINAIGMTGISSARKRDFKILKLDGKEPNYDNIRKGKYLLYRPLYVITDRDSEYKNEMDRFLEFAHSKEGRDIIRNNGVVPYLEALNLTTKQREQWKTFRKPLAAR